MRFCFGCEAQKIVQQTSAEFYKTAGHDFFHNVSGANNGCSNNSKVPPTEPLTYHQLYVRPYLLKNRVKHDTIVFIFTTADEYMKKAFYRHGWLENEVAEARVFDLRWDLNQNAVSFEELRPGQLCNHFPHSEELTTKTGLARNIQKLAEAGVDPDKFFPRCYDFTEEKAMGEFVKDWEETAVVNLVKKHVEFFRRAHEK